MHSPAVLTAQWPYSTAPARAGLCAAFPARSPRLPALARSLRAACVFPDPHSEGVVLFYNNRERWVIRNGHAT